MTSAQAIPMLSINPSYMAMYYDYERTSARSQAQLANEANLKDNRHHGNISLKANKRMKAAIHWLISFADEKSVFHRLSGKSFRFKVGFVTLTLAAAQVHTDKVIKKELLNHFFVVAKRRWQVTHYVWKAERQKNGNIHFHILTDKFIPYAELRSVWNTIQNKLGYVDTFAAKNGHYEPNSTDIHSIKHVKNVAAYMVKYMTKQESGESMQGNIWGLSQSLSKMKSFTLPVDQWVQESLNELYDKFSDRLISGDYFSVLYVSFDQWRKSINSKLQVLFQEYILSWKQFFESDQETLCFSYT